MNLTIDDVMDRVKEICLESGFEDYDLFNSIDDEEFTVTIAFYEDEEHIEDEWTEVTWIQEFDTDADGELMKPYLEIRNGGDKKPNVTVNLFTYDQMMGLRKIADMLQIDMVRDMLLETRLNHKDLYDGLESAEED